MLIYAIHRGGKSFLSLLRSRACISLNDI